MRTFNHWTGKVLFQLGSAACLAVLASGCSICAPGYLDDYATVGGKWERGDPTSGRVGSPMSGAGSSLSGYMETIDEGEVYYEGEAGQSDMWDADMSEAYSEEIYLTPVEEVPAFEESSIILGEDF